MKNLCFLKDALKSAKINHELGEMLTNHVSDKGLVFRHTQQ